MSKTAQAFTSSTEMEILVFVLRPKKEFPDLNWFKRDSSVILSW